MISDCVQDVVEFQSLCGKLDLPATRKTLQEQALLIVEEAKELAFAIDNESCENILKELVDNLVVVFGMVAMLNRSGYKVYDAWSAVNANNMSKFCTSQTDGFYTLSAYQATEQGEYTLRQVDYNRWGVFDSNGKLRKPIGYEKVSVLTFVPN